MNIEELDEVYNKRVKEITKEFVQQMICNLGLCGCSLYNRVVITEQLKGEITDVRTYGDWELLGRTVGSYGSKIYILESKNIKEYIDNKTGKVVDYSELTPDEMESALKYNLIRVEEREAEKSVATAYRYEDTLENNKKYNKIERLTFNDVCKALKNIYGIDINIGNYNGYNNGIIYFNVKEPKQVIATIAKFICSRTSVENFELIDCALNALFGIRKEISNSNIDINELEKIFIITDEIMYMSGKVKRKNRVSEIQLKRNSKILGIIQSVYMREQLG